MRAIVPIADLTRRIPEAGRIRIGEKAGNRPVAISEFRFTSHDRVALDQIAALYGGTVKPWSDPKAAEGQFQVKTDATEIRVVLPPDPLGGTPIYEMWGGGGCDRRCDGEIAEVLTRGPEGPEPTEVPCICMAKQEMACKPVIRLSVILPEVRFAGVWRLDTHGWNALEELPGMVEMIQGLQTKGMPYATLAIKHRRSVAAGQTRKFLVPVLGVGASIEQLAAGGASLGSLPAGAAPALGAGEVVDGPGKGPASDASEVGRVEPARHAEPAPVHPADEFPGFDAQCGAPENPGDDDIVDAEIVDDEPAADVEAALEQAHIPQASALKRARELAGEAGDPVPLSIDEIGSELLARVVATFDGSASPSPAASSEAERAGMTQAQSRKLHAALRERGIVGPERHEWASATLGHDVASMSDLSREEANQLIDAIERVPV